MRTLLFLYTRSNIEKTTILKEGFSTELSKDLSLRTPIKHVHGVETYGLIFSWREKKIGYISDTKFFDRLIGAYSEAKDLLIVNVTLLNPNPKIDHLSVPDAEEIIGEIKPNLAILTHFGRTMIKAKPWEVALDLTKRLGVKVIAAYDNMILDLNTLSVVKQR
jgi:phosphoribosyl 1,2-cyclic phosphodiesterase